MAAYDKNVDYSDLIAAEAAKGVNADRQLLAQLEAARNAKICGRGPGLRPDQRLHPGARQPRRTTTQLRTTATT